MQKSSNIKPKQVIFSKWSRMGFAVFASLGKVVKIAHLKVEICNQAIQKNLNLLSDFFENAHEKIIQEFDESIELLLAQWFDGLMIVQNEKEISNKVNNINIAYNQVRPDLSWTDF